MYILRYIGINANKSTLPKKEGFMRDLKVKEIPYFKVLYLNRKVLVYTNGQS